MYRELHKDKKEHLAMKCRSDSLLQTNVKCIMHIWVVRLTSNCQEVFLVVQAS